MLVTYRGATVEIPDEMAVRLVEQGQAAPVSKADVQAAPEAEQTGESEEKPAGKAPEKKRGRGK